MLHSHLGGAGQGQSSVALRPLLDEDDGKREGFLGTSGPAMECGGEKRQRKKPSPLGPPRVQGTQADLFWAFVQKEGRQGENIVGRRLCAGRDMRRTLTRSVEEKEQVPGPKHG